MGSKQIISAILIASLASGAGYWLGRRQTARTALGSDNRSEPTASQTGSMERPAASGESKWTAAEVEGRIASLRESDRRGIKDLISAFGSLDPADIPQVLAA